MMFPPCRRVQSGTTGGRGSASIESECRARAARSAVGAAEWNQRIIGQSRAVRPVRRGGADKGLEQFAHGALGQVTGDEHQPGAVVVVRPALQPRSRMEDMLYAVHYLSLIHISEPTRL